MGESLTLAGSVEIQAEAPARARLRLLRDGEPVAEAEGQRLVWRGHRPGVYRLEAYRRYTGRQRGWIFANPIYVR